MLRHFADSKEGVGSERGLGLKEGVGYQRGLDIFEDLLFAIYT